MHIECEVFAFIVLEDKDSSKEPRKLQHVVSVFNPEDTLAPSLWRLPGATATRSPEEEWDLVQILASAVLKQTGINIKKSNTITCVHSDVVRVSRPVGGRAHKKYTKTVRYYYVSVPFDDFIHRKNGFELKEGCGLDCNFTPRYVVQHPDYYPPHKEAVERFQHTMTETPA